MKESGGEVLLKVAMVSRATVGSYTSKLVKGFKKSCPQDRISVYGPKGEVRSEDYIRILEVWTPGLYPFQIFRQVCHDKPELVHIQHEFGMFGNALSLFLSPFLYILLKLLRVRTVTTLHSLIFPDLLSKDSLSELLPFASRIPPIVIATGLRVIYSSACGFSDRVIVHQPSHKKKLQAYYGINESKISFIPHGVGPTEYSADEASISAWRTKFGRRRIMLYLGYLSPRKGLEYLIDAFETFSKRRPEWALVLAGGLSKKYYEPYRKRIENIINEKDLDDKIVLTGFVPEKDADALYRLCDFVVLPYTQAVGNASACNLAMGYGKPIIASTLSPFPEEIENLQEGILCPPRDAAKLLDAMEVLASNEKLYMSISQNLRVLENKRGWESVASLTDKLYEIIR